MTDRKTPTEEPGVIEGVAVEKQPAGRKRRASGKQQASSAGGGTAGTGTGNAGAHARDDRPGRPGRAGMSVATLMAMAAILIAGAGLAVQEWRAIARVEALQGEIAALTAQLTTAEEIAGTAQDEAARLSGRMAERLAALEAAIPDDPQTAISDLAGAQDDLAQRLDALESTSASASASATSSAAGDASATEMALAQSALTVASAMLADSLAGGDAGRWLPVLDELEAAGLDLGDLAALRAALSPPPPSTPQLLATAKGMMPSLREAARDTRSGWWSSTADTLAGFVTLRRQDEAGDAVSADSGSPLAGFKDAIAAGHLAAALAASENLAAALPDHAGRINSWRIAATRRLAADDALAGFSAAIAARLARHGAGGKGE